MKVYVDFEELDVEDRPTYICNKYNLQVKSINSGTRYDNVKLVSLADYTKQVRKEVLEQVYKVFTTEDVWTELKSWWLQNGTCEELKNCLDAMVEETSVENIVKKFGHNKMFYQMLDHIQGETEWK